MSLLAAAQNTLDMGSASMLALQIFDTLSRSTQPNPKQALLAVRAVVLMLWEGYQGKIRGRAICGALEAFALDLRHADGIPDEAMLAKFRGAL